LAHARITSLSAPGTLTPGAAFTATLHPTGYIQTVQDISVAFGLAPWPGYPNSLGRTTVESVYLGPSKSNVLEDINVTMTAPQQLGAGEKMLFSAAVFSLYGALGMPVVEVFNVSVVV
ncbi:uncharacterized protein K452DRAFT_195131, partial [Aplosporella prunicola CBS 121167]